MSNSTCDPLHSICDDSFLKDEVVLMEDNSDTLEAIQKIFENDFNWKVTIAENQQEVVKLAQDKSAAYFILDNEIRNNKQEGTMALGKIRKMNSTPFVTIFSAHPDTEVIVKRLKGNLFELKKGNLKKNSQHIYSEILKYRLQIVEKLEKEIPTIKADIVEKLQSIENLDKLYVNKDPNIAAYESLKSDPKWLKKYQGEYVAFVDGKFQFSHSDRKDFFDKLIESQKYKQKQVFYIKVEHQEEQERIIEILPSMELLLNE